MPFFDAALIKSLALHISRQSKVSQTEALQFFKTHRETLQKLSQNHYEVLRIAANSLVHWDIAVELLQIPHLSNPINKSGWDAFIFNVDNSECDLKNWLLAIEKVVEWNNSRGISSNYSKMIGYVHCCAESIQGKEYPLQLKDIVSEMLERFGFEG